MPATPHVRFVAKGRPGKAPVVRFKVYAPSLRTTLATPWLRLRYGRRHCGLPAAR